MSITRRELVSNSLVASLGVAVAGAVAQRARAQDGPPAPAPETNPSTATKPAALRIQIAIFDGFLATDALAPFDALKVASKVGAAIETTLVTVDGAAEVNALDDLRVKPTAAFDPSADVLLVPGAPSLWRSGVTPPGLAEACAAFRAPGKLLVTVCTGAVFAARAGLLQGRNANTHKTAQSLIVELGAILQDVRVVDDGDLLSSGGVTGGIDLALYLIERYFGAAPAIQTQTIFEYERRGVVWRA
jgi:transcriptional regulator GlxA family with amidase domain